MVVTGHVYPFDTVDKMNAERGTLDACKQAMELAYGLLWMVGCDRSTENGQCLYLARKALYERITKDEQARGITAARKAIVDAPPLRDKVYEEIMAMSDDDLVAELAKEGETLESNAAKMQAIFHKAKAEADMRLAIKAWLKCPAEKRPTPTALGQRVAEIAALLRT